MEKSGFTALGRSTAGTVTPWLLLTLSCRSAAMITYYHTKGAGWAAYRPPEDSGRERAPLLLSWTLKRGGLRWPSSSHTHTFYKENSLVHPDSCRVLYIVYAVGSVSSVSKSGSRIRFRNWTFSCLYGFTFNTLTITPNALLVDLVLDITSSNGPKV